MSEAEERLFDIEVIPAAREQEGLLANLLELYVYDFSELLGLEPGDDGRFGYPQLPLYWSEKGRHAFLVRAEAKPAGFVLVKQGRGVLGGELVWDVAEFFVLRGYRRRGIGMQVAHDVWRRFPGMWEVRVLEANVAAGRFWTRAVERFTGEDAKPVRIAKDRQWWQVFAFESKKS